jgi:hypothetical protein
VHAINFYKYNAINFPALRGGQSNRKDAKNISADNGHSLYEERNRRWTQINADLLHRHKSHGRLFFSVRNARIGRHHRKARRVRKEEAARG